MIGNWIPACNEFNGVDVVCSRWLGHSVRAQGLSIDPINDRQPARWGQRHRDGIFCKAVDGGHGVEAEPKIGKAIHEPAQRLGAHRFGAIGDVA